MSLDCYFCGKEFGDFAPLAHHVQVVHMQRPWHLGPEERKAMNIGSYVQGSAGGNYPPPLDAKLFKKLQKSGRVTGKVLAVRVINSPKFKGLALDMKNGVQKFGFLTGFDRYDIGAIVRQLKSEETDDWIGETISFIAKKGSKGGTFVNVENPKRKK